MTCEMGDPVLSASGIVKSFPGVKALDDVSLTLKAGQLTALLGENGAGKSTLMNILAGVFPQDSGELVLGGNSVRFANVREANEAGISMIFQELNLVSHLTVAENIFLGREPVTRWGLIDTGSMHHQAAALLGELDLDVRPETPLSQLRVGQQQVVEIAKAISYDAQVLIMDEPTSAITEHEIEVLFGIIEKLKAQGVAIAYITHKMEELRRIADEVVVMRDGKTVGSGALGDFSSDDIVRLMVGREVLVPDAPPSSRTATEALGVKNLSLPHPSRVGDFLFRDVSFSVNRGEILGIFGLMGAGRTEILEAVFGLHASSAVGEILIDRKPTKLESPADAIRHGLALAPEDRKGDGIFAALSVAENASLASLDQMERLWWIDRQAEQKLVEQSIERFRVKTPSTKQLISNLSGGNQQKVILAKWFATKPKVLLLDEPTRGIDVNAKAEIYELIQNLVADGLAVILVSSELPEVQALSDRVIVLCEGSLRAEFDRSEANEEAIMSAALPR